MKKCFDLALVFALCTGCQAPRLADFGPRYHVSNVHATVPRPPSMRRVLVLPTAQTAGVAPGADQVVPVLATELRKAALFEIVTLSASQMALWSGRPAWSADEALPIGLLSRLQEETGCDAVLFSTLNTFRPYPPLAIGWDLRLVDCREHRTWWAVDEVLDGGAAEVGRSARDYGRNYFPSRMDEGDSVLQSPARFAQFAAASLIATLPPQ